MEKKRETDKIIWSSADLPIETSDYFWSFDDAASRDFLMKIPSAHLLRFPTN